MLRICRKPGVTVAPRSEPTPDESAENAMSLGTILLILLILILLGVLPTWPHSRSWGYYPVGGVGLVLIIVLILVLMGRI